MHGFHELCLLSSDSLTLCCICWVISYLPQLSSSPLIISTLCFLTCPPVVLCLQTHHLISHMSTHLLPIRGWCVYIYSPPTSMLTVVAVWFFSWILPACLVTQFVCQFCLKAYCWLLTRNRLNKGCYILDCLACLVCSWGLNTLPFLGVLTTRLFTAISKNDLTTFTATK